MAHNDHAYERVPDSQRYGWRGMIMVWLGFILAFSNLMSGGLIADSLSMGWTVLAIIVGSVILAIVAAFQASVGQKTGLSTHITIRFAFGNIGAKIVSCSIAIALIGWVGVGIGAAAQAVSYYIDIHPAILSVVMGSMMIITAIYGYKGLEYLNKFAVPLIILFCLVGLGVVYFSDSFDMTKETVNNAPNFFKGASQVIAAWITAALIAGDIGRYAKTKKDATLASGLGILIGNVVLMSCGAAFAIATKVSGYDIVGMVAGLGLGISGMFFMIFIQWTTVNSNIYSASLGIANGLDTNKKNNIAIIAGLIGIALAALDIYNNFIFYLEFLGVFFPPVAGVVMIDYLFFKSKYDGDFKKITRKINWYAITAWACGSAAGYYSTFFIPPVNAIIVSGIVYYALEKVVSNAVEQDDLSSYKNKIA